MTETAGPDWARIRAEYEAGQVPLDELVAAHAIKRNQLNYQRRKEGWILRHPVTSRRGLLKRMLALIERQIARMEQKLTEEPMSATEMRMLESMTKAIDRIGAMEAAEKKASSGRTRMDPELEAIRERLVQRIEELDVEQ